MRRLIAVVLAACMTLAVPVVAKSKGGSSSHKNSSSSKKSGSPKTVHVKGYTKKDGTKVKAHDRAAPGSKGHKGAPAPAAPPPSPSPAPSPAAGS